MKKERKEILMRIVIGIVSGLILGIWESLIIALSAVNWIYTFIVGKRIKDLAEFCEIWNTQSYIFLRYLTLVSNERPFPFRKLTKNMSKFR